MKEEIAESRGINHDIQKLVGWERTKVAVCGQNPES